MNKILKKISDSKITNIIIVFAFFSIFLLNHKKIESYVSSIGSMLSINNTLDKSEDNSDTDKITENINGFPETKGKFNSSFIK